MYKVFLALGLPTVFLWPFVYYYVWQPNITFRDYKYFHVRSIERTYCGKFELICGWIMALTFILIGDIVFNNRYALNIPMQFLLLGILVLEVLMIDFLGNKLHRCLPLRNVLNINDMIESIESEAFIPIGKYVWQSEHWIRIGHQFYPKSMVCVVDRKRFFKTHYFRVCTHTMDGKSHQGMIYLGIDPAFIDSLYNINKVLPVRKYFTDQDWKKFQWKLSKNQFDCVKESLFRKYMSTHTTNQMIKNKELVQSLVEKINTLDSLDEVSKELELDKIRANEAIS